MASMVRDNGMVSPYNRGSFYASRDEPGQLEGAALVCHVTVIEAETEASLSAFARLTRHCLNTHLIRGERHTIEKFWRFHAKFAQEPRRISLDRILELRAPLPAT